MVHFLKLVVCVCVFLGAVPGVLSQNRNFFLPSQQSLNEEAPFIWWSFVPSHVERILHEESARLVEIFDSVSESEFQEKIHKLSSEDLEFSLMYLGWLRLHRMYGDHPLTWTYYDRKFFYPPAEDCLNCDDLPLEDFSKESDVSPTVLRAYPLELNEWKKRLINEQKISRMGYSIRSSWYTYRAAYSEIKTKLKFVESPDCPEEEFAGLTSLSKKFLRELGFFELIEHRHFLSGELGQSFLGPVEHLITRYTRHYFPYESARVEVFKRYSYQEGSRKNYYEFETIWTDSQFDGHKNERLMALGLVSSGADSSPTPSGEYQLYGIHKNWKNTGGDRMPGAFLLSKKNDKNYCTRALHGTTGYGAGKFGTPASKGCIRQYTQVGDSYGGLHGFVDVLWGSLNPHNFSGADHLEGGFSWRTEPPLMREVIRQARSKIQFHVYGSLDSSRTHKASSARMTSHFRSVSAKTGSGILSVTSRLKSRSVIHRNPANTRQTRYGKYLVFDDGVKRRMFQTTVPKSKYYSSRHSTDFQRLSSE